MAILLFIVGGFIVARMEAKGEPDSLPRVLSAQPG
jgi:hypothetical protein